MTAERDNRAHFALKYMFRAALRAAAYALLLAVSAAAVNSAHAQPPGKRPKGGEPFTVLEFFNSENCLHCRRATEQVRRLHLEAKDAEERLFVLTYHVDYLEAEGWEDIYEDPAFSDRQRAYKRELSQKMVLPGQVVLNGSYPALGEHTDLIEEASRRFLTRRAKAELFLKAALRPERNQIRVTVEVEGLRGVRRDHFLFHAVLVEDGVVRKISSGPNAGYTMEHTNLVRAFETAKIGKDWKGAVSLNLPEKLSRKDAAVVCFIQDPITMEIYGAEQFLLSGFSKRAAPRSGSTDEHTSDDDADRSGK